MARRSTRLSRLRFCGSEGTCASTLLSAAGPALLGFLTSRDALALRGTCREALDAVASFPWEESGYWSEADEEWVSGTLIARGDTPLQVCLQRWRRCFPCARGANLAGSLDLSVEDVQCHLTGLRSIDLSECPALSDAHLAPLVGLQRLVMNSCSQPAITDAALAPLAGSLRFLVCGNCPQLTSAAFAHLQGVETLVCWNNDSEALGDAGFRHLRGSIRTLVMGNCNQVSITDATLASLGGTLERLVMWGCTQPTITDRGFAHLGSLVTLNISGCSQETITDGAFEALKGLKELLMVGCTQITDEAFKHFSALEYLDCSHCPQLTGSGLVHLKAIKTLQHAPSSSSMKKHAKALKLRLSG